MGTELNAAQRQARETLGRNIMQYRQQRGWTIERLATETGYSRSWIGGVERAQMNSSTDRLASIAAALGIGLHMLFLSDAEVLD